MKKLFLLFLFLCSVNGFSQEDAWVYFKDKPNAQTFIDNPSTMLSQRALDRRTRQSIALDTKDAPIHQIYIDQITASTGITVLAKSKWLNALHIRGSQANIAALTGLFCVDHVQYANHSLNPDGKTVPAPKKTKKGKDPKNAKGIETTFNYGASSTQIQMLNGHILHQQDFTGQGMLVAIMDAGFPGVNSTAPFQRLRDNGLILGGYDFVDRTPNPYVGNQHGTQVLSNMGGFVDGQLVGTAPDASYYLFRTEDTVSPFPYNENPIEESNWVEAAEMADSLGVDIISTSLGYFEYDNPDYSYTYDDLNGIKAFMSRGVDVAFSRGMITVTSAGNSGSSSNPYIAVPADALTTLAIGAVNASEIRSGFSSIGPSFDGRIKPDLMAMGVSAVVATQTGSITTASGTSFSGPILAGAITSFWSAFPDKTNAEIVQMVKASADRYSSPDNEYGYGIPNFQLALLSLEENESNQINIFPNPTNDYLTISSSIDIVGAAIVFYNSLGQKIFTQNIDSPLQNISLQSLSNGIYYYTITSARKTLNGKIIKN